MPPKVVTMLNRLTDSELISRAVIEDLKATAFKTDIHGRWTLLNPAWTELTGFQVDESIGAPFTDFVHPDDRQTNLDLFLELVQGTKDFFRNETRYVTRSGLFRWVEVYARLLPDSEGEPAGVTGTLTDITERKGVEEKNRDLLHALEAAMDGVALVNDRGEYTHLNRAHLEMFGFSRAEDLLGKTWREIYYPDEIQRIESEVFPALLANGSWTGSATAKRNDGTTFPEELSLTLLPDGGLVCICRDVTEKIRAAEALRASEARWQLAVESITDGIWDADLKTGDVHLSQGWRALLGLADSELITTWKELSMRIHPDDQRVSQDATDPHCVLKTLEYDAELRMLANDGIYRWLQVRGRGLVGERGEVVRMVGIASDVSSRKQIYEQMLANVAREKDLTEMKSHFVSMASHELRTPLATLTMALEFLTTYRQQLSENLINKSLLTANEAARHLSSIVDDLLFLGRADEGKIECSTQLINVRDHLVMLASESRLPGAGMNRIKVICEPALLQANLDPQLLRHMLLNLLSNACKYSPEHESVYLRARKIQSGVEFQVLDSGIGIRPEDQNRVFSLFYRGQNVGSIPGTGLGLMVVRHCVEAHGGVISFESNVGKGTCFTITISD
jgi:PAS domain S-box-containing protein